MVLATCRNSLNTKKIMIKAGLHAQCSCLLLLKPELRTTGWEPVLWKKCKVVAKHKLKVLEAGTLKVKARKLYPLFCSSLERPQLEEWSYFGWTHEISCHKIVWVLKAYRNLKA